LAVDDWPPVDPTAASPMAGLAYLLALGPPLGVALLNPDSFFSMLQVGRRFAGGFWCLGGLMPVVFYV
jgi:hypothetical protein